LTGQDYLRVSNNISCESLRQVSEIKYFQENLRVLFFTTFELLLDYENSKACPKNGMIQKGLETTGLEPATSALQGRRSPN
jgi:hypothetical protein